MTAHFAPSQVRPEAGAILRAFGSSAALAATGGLRIRSPITGEEIALLAPTSSTQAEQAIGAAQAAFQQWRSVPAPRRGELVRLLGDELQHLLDRRVRRGGKRCVGEEARELSDHLC
ncbi:MAG: aldehyde dehydrogenase family protein, partial [Geminicoccaceae bacterium]